MADDHTGMDIDRLVAEHHQAVYRYAYRLAGSTADAEDLTQQVFLIAQQKLDQLRQPKDARGWLFAILRNSFLRGRQRLAPVSTATLELDIDSIPAEIPDEDDIDRERLQAAINELPDEFRVVLVMFYFEECSYREIAQSLDMPMGTVMSRLARAKGHLRAKLFEPEPTQGPTLQPRTATQQG